MPKYTTKDIRNLVLAGGAFAGKTTLVEHLLHHVGLIPRPGRVEDGNTVCDYDALEKEYKHSLDSALVHFDSHGAHINIIDTPGSADFLGKSISCFPAVETIAIVVSAATGVDTVTRRLMKIAAERNLPRIIIVNKIDHGDDLEEILLGIQETFGPECLPINLPINKGAALVDCINTTSGDSDLGPVAKFHTAIIDQIVEMDEDLMAQYLETQEVRPEQLHEPFEKALRDGHLVPVCFTSARNDVGLKELLDFIVHYCPNPLEGNPRPFECTRDGKITEYTATADSSKPLLAHVFKVTSDPYVGRLSFFKVHQGHVSHDLSPKLDDGRKPIRIAHVFKLQGKDHKEIDQLIAGDIGAVSKIDEIKYNSILHTGEIGDHVHLKALPLPKPMYGLAIVAANKAAEAKLGESLHRLIAEDPTFQVEHVMATHQTVIRGLGEIHLRAKLRLLKDRYGLEVTSQPPKVAYKETVTSKADGHHRHKKQTGGAGQFGEVYLSVEPLNGETEEIVNGLKFIDDTFGGSVPRQFLPAIEKGVRQVMTDGAIAGYPMQGITVRVTDGKYHPVDSKEVAFVTAGRKAFIDAVQKARPVLLEPIVKLEITVPADMIGDISSDLSGRRGRIHATDMLPGNQAVVVAEAPLSELMTYSSQLKSMTAGAGSYNMEYSHDDITPPNIQAEVVKAFKPRPDEE